MSTPLSPATGGLLMGLRQQLESDVERAKQEIEQKVGTVVTEIHVKLREADQGMLTLTEAGRRIMEQMERRRTP